DEIRWTGQAAADGPPLRMLDGELPVADGTVALPLTGLDETSVYHLILSPGGHGATKGDTVIDRLDLTLRDTEDPAPYDAEYADLRDGARVSHAHRGASGPGVAVLPRGGTATFWVHAADDGEVTVTVDRLGPGEGLVTVDGETVGRVEEGPLPLFLAGGVNKVTVTGTSERLIVDRLRVGPPRGLLPGTAYAAEDGILTGTAKVTALPYATGGKAVDGIGGGPGNALTLTVTARHAGRHALTIRYSDGEHAPDAHDHPDPVCRHADLTVNGGAPHRVLFPTTFHFNAFRTLTVPVTLVQGANTLTFTADELPDWDGELGGAHGRLPGCAPVIDRVMVTPLTVPR
ncbi:MAG: hypothetical protein HOZ81_11125, partial [Streptomyces sp.]|nr:hypothetical protein [Streptomyces sp.]